MNAKRLNVILAMSLIFGMAQAVCAKSLRESVWQGNELYNQGNFHDAVKKYDEALVESPQAMEPKFNKADSFYRLDDLGQAIEQYKQVAAESKDMKLVTAAKYNLGNCYFQQGCKQRDSNLQKAIEDLQTGIGYWRGVLDIDAGNEKAARNIEVARLTIKDMIDQMKKQQEDKKNQKQDPNQSQQQQQQQQGGNSQQDPNQQQKKEGQQDPNKSQEPNQPQKKKESPAAEPNQAKEPNKPKQQKAEQKEQKQNAPDTTAQEILDKEQQRNKERQQQQNAGYQKVDKDW